MVPHILSQYTSTAVISQFRLHEYEPSLSAACIKPRLPLHNEGLFLLFQIPKCRPGSLLARASSQKSNLNQVLVNRRQYRYHQVRSSKALRKIVNNNNSNPSNLSNNINLLGGPIFSTKI